MARTSALNVTPIGAREPPRRRGDVHPTLLRKSAARPTPNNPFVAPSFPDAVERAVQDAGLPLLAQDDAISGAFSWAGSEAIYSAFAEGLVFLGYSYLATLAQRPEYRVVSETIASEMTREWIEFKVSSGDESKSDKVKRIEDELDRLNVRDAFRRVAEHDGFFGRGHLYLDTGRTGDPDELKMDLGNGRNTMSRLKVGRLEGQQRLRAVRAVEPTWAYPTRYESSDPLAPNWYRPETWYVMQREVHSTRFLTFIGRAVPDVLKPAYAFGGLSMSQMLKPYVDNWLRTRQSVADLVNNFSVNVLKTSLDATTSVGGDKVLARVQLFNNLKNNQGTMVLDKEGEDFGNVSAPLATMDSIQAQSQEHMAAVARIPLVKLLGIQPAGLNASSEGELIAFEDWIAAFQELLFRPHLTTILDFVQLSIFGEVDQDITYDFRPLRQLKPLEKMQLELTKVQVREGYVSMGAVDAAEVREVAANDPDTPLQGIDLSQPLPAPPMPGFNEEGGEPPPEFGLGHNGGPDLGSPDELPLWRYASDAGFEESEHKRDRSGQFSSGGASGRVEDRGEDQPLYITDIKKP